MTRRLQERKERAKLYKELTTKKINHESTLEESQLEAKYYYNSVNFNIFRKQHEQKRGKEVDFSLEKQEVNELITFLTNIYDNWDELKNTDKTDMNSVLKLKSIMNSEN